MGNDKLSKRTLNSYYYEKNVSDIKIKKLGLFIKNSNNDFDFSNEYVDYISEDLVNRDIDNFDALRLETYMSQKHHTFYFEAEAEVDSNKIKGYIPITKSMYFKLMHYIKDFNNVNVKITKNIYSSELKTIKTSIGAIHIDTLGKKTMNDIIYQNPRIKGGSHLYYDLLLDQKPLPHPNYNFPLNHNLTDSNQLNNFMRDANAKDLREYGKIFLDAVDYSYYNNNNLVIKVNNV